MKRSVGEQLAALRRLLCRPPLTSYPVPPYLYSVQVVRGGPGNTALEILGITSTETQLISATETLWKSHQATHDSKKPTIFDKKLVGKRPPEPAPYQNQGWCRLSSPEVQASQYNDGQYLDRRCRQCDHVPENLGYIYLLVAEHIAPRNKHSRPLGEAAWGNACGRLTGERSYAMFHVAGDPGQGLAS